MGGWNAPNCGLSQAPFEGKAAEIDKEAVSAPYFFSCPQLVHIFLTIQQRTQ